MYTPLYLFVGYGKASQLIYSVCVIRAIMFTKVIVFKLFVCETLIKIMFSCSKPFWYLYFIHGILIFFPRELEWKPIIHGLYRL